MEFMDLKLSEVLDKLKTGDKLKVALSVAQAMFIVCI
jgi:hypothetical protein